MSFPKQFLLGEQKPEAPEGWVYRQVGRFHLAHSPDLPARTIKSRGTGLAPGILLGWPIPEPASSDSLVEDDLGGRWIHISDDGLLSLDALGSYSVVYSPATRIAASSTAVMPQSVLIENHDLNAVLGLPDKDNWYPFGLTPFVGFERLLPNHCLDLETFTPQRIAEPPRLDPSSDPIDVIASNLHRQLSHLGSLYPLCTGLTAGNETRMILAGLRGVQERSTFFTISDGRESQDIRTARHLAKKFGLYHEVKVSTHCEAAASAWFERVGASVAGATMRNAGVKKTLPCDAILLKGIGGEIGRGYLYNKEDTEDMLLTPPEIVRRLRLPIHPEIMERAEDWLAKAPPVGAFDILDLLYIENRIGCWAAPQIHGDVYNLACLWPLNQRSTVAAMRALSYHQKTEDLMCPLVVEKLWPELLFVPVNRPFGFRQRFGLTRPALQRAIRRWPFGFEPTQRPH